MLAVMAESTRMHSKPSRKTSTPMFRMAAVELVPGFVGSGAPCAAMPCQSRTATTSEAPKAMAVLTPGVHGLGGASSMNALFSESEIVITLIEIKSQQGYVNN